MTRWNLSMRRLLAGAGLLLPAVIAGCQHLSPCCIDNCATVPKGAQPAPNGTYVHRVQEIQAAKAEADDFVIYKYEWCMGGSELGPFGKYHLNEMIKRLPFVPFPILIQAHTLDGELNEARRCYIVRALQLNGIPDAEQRVLLGFPEAEGLYGDEAERIYLQMLTPGGGLGFGVGGFGGGFGSFGFGGFGGPFGGFGGLGFGASPFFGGGGIGTFGTGAGNFPRTLY
jgi:hypothetical protein